MLVRVERALAAYFGSPPARASMSFVGVDRIQVLRFAPIPGERTYLSLGMARHPMVGADELLRPADAPRAELMLNLRDPGDVWSTVWRNLALLAATPAVESFVYSEGVSVDLGQPLADGSACVGVIVVQSPIPSIGSGHGEVAILQVIPATSAELAWCRVRGSDALRQRWEAVGTDLQDLGRRGVELS